jgi:ribulose-5-phosphate 4-epimerase/fuculose-1-phosphate aldolase
MSAAEVRQARVDLAACYRLLAHFRMTDLIYTHVTARVPGDGHRVLINPYGQLFHEITASSLIEVDMERPLSEQSPQVNVAGFFIHGAVHEARPDVGCAIHIHTAATIAVSAYEDGLLPISQHALKFHNRIGYHDYNGVATDAKEQELLARDLGPHDAMLLRNHGALVVGATVAEAFINTHYLERACQAQVDACAMGGRLRKVTPEVADETGNWLATNAERRRKLSGGLYKLEWDALLRMLDAGDGSFRD